MLEAVKPKPADRCDDTPGRLRPVIDRDRCEGKESCVEVCPYDVFERGTLSADETRALSWLGWFKSLAHGWGQAYAVRADKDIEAALAGLSTFSDAYQAAVDQPQPLFRRRAA